ncbi:MAG: DUF1611 domain-containing protein [Candidatus Krumholzibacteriia bacterium]
MDGSAVILTQGLFTAAAGKTAHGLVRGTERYRIVGLLDGAATAGRDAGELLDGAARGIPCFASWAALLAAGVAKPDWCIVGVANPGGVLPPELRAPLREALRLGVSVVSGLHDLLGDDPELAGAAARTGATLLDLRRPRPRADLHFFTGAIGACRVPRLALLGTDCALGKRTTARLLLEACRADGLRAELVFTGQTGWLQGHPHGFILDATPNDFVAGEIEHWLLRCARETTPDLILVPGQSGLRNPSGPCGTEIILAGDARGVILQHAPGRRFYKDVGGARWPIPHPRDDVALVRLCGAEVLAVALHTAGLTTAAARDEAACLADELALPVVLPLVDGVGALLPLVRRFVATERGRL